MALNSTKRTSSPQGDMSWDSTWDSYLYKRYTVDRGYSVPPHKRNTNLRVGDEIAPLYSPSCTFCNSCTLRDISSRPVPTCSALNFLCMDIRLQGVCASILVRISRLRTSPAQDGIAPIKLQNAKWLLLRVALSCSGQKVQYLV